MASTTYSATVIGLPDSIAGIYTGAKARVVSCGVVSSVERTDVVIYLLVGEKLFFFIFSDKQHIGRRLYIVVVGHLFRFGTRDALLLHAHVSLLQKRHQGQ